MRPTLRSILLALGALAVASGLLALPGTVREAQAIIGRPLTPLSFAGVARRTTRRAVWAGAATGYGYGYGYGYPYPYPGRYYPGYIW